MRWWTATPSRRELVTPIFLLNTWEHYIQWDLWKLDFWALFCDTRPIYRPLALLEARMENSPASEPLQQTNGTVSGSRAFLVPSAKATTVPNLSRSSVWAAKYYLDLLPAKAKSCRCKSTKWFVRGWKPAEKIFTLLGTARNISDLADSFTWASIDMALQLHSCGTSHWQNHNHHACIARRWRTFHNVSGYERLSTAKALTTQHQGNMMSIQHLGIQSILLLREVYRVNSFVCETSQGLFT